MWPKPLDQREGRDGQSLVQEKEAIFWKSNSDRVKSLITICYYYYLNLLQNFCCDFFASEFIWWERKLRLLITFYKINKINKVNKI